MPISTFSVKMYVFLSRFFHSGRSRILVWFEEKFSSILYEMSFSRGRIGQLFCSVVMIFVRVHMEQWTNWPWRAFAMASGGAWTPKHGNTFPLMVIAIEWMPLSIVLLEMPYIW